MHHLKKLNQGLENKIIELQQKLMAQVSHLRSLRCECLTGCSAHLLKFQNLVELHA